MKVRELDSKHDWTFGGSMSNFISDSDAIAQCVKTKCLSFFGNWKLDPEHGIRWFDHFERNADYLMCEADIIQNVSEVWGVKSVISVALLLDTATRKLTVDVTYNDIYGNKIQVLANVRD